MKKYALVDKKGGQKVLLPLGAPLTSVSSYLPTLSGTPYLPGLKVNSINMPNPLQNHLNAPLPYTSPVSLNTPISSLSQLSSFFGFGGPGQVIKKTVTTTTNYDDKSDSWTMEDGKLVNKDNSGNRKRTFNKITIIFFNKDNQSMLSKNKDNTAIETTITKNDFEGSLTFLNAVNRFLKDQNINIPALNYLENITYLEDKITVTITVSDAQYIELSKKYDK